MQFKYNTQGTASFLVCSLDPDERIDQLGRGMLENNQIPSVMPMAFSQMDEKRFINWNISSKIDLQSFLTRPLRQDKLMEILSCIANALSSTESYLLDNSMFLMDLKYVFVEVGTGKTSLIYLPVIRETQELDLKSFVKGILEKALFDPNENTQFVAVLLNILNRNSTLTPADLLSAVGEIRRGGLQNNYYTNRNGRGFNNPGRAQYNNINADYNQYGAASGAGNLNPGYNQYGAEVRGNNASHGNNYGRPGNNGFGGRQQQYGPDGRQRNIQNNQYGGAPVRNQDSNGTAQKTNRQMPPANNVSFAVPGQNDPYGMNKPQEGAGQNGVRTQEEQKQKDSGKKHFGFFKKKDKKSENAGSQFETTQNTAHKPESISVNGGIKLPEISQQNYSGMQERMNSRSAAAGNSNPRQSVQMPYGQNLLYGNQYAGQPNDRGRAGQNPPYGNQYAGQANGQIRARQNPAYGTQYAGQQNSQGQEGHNQPYGNQYPAQTNVQRHSVQGQYGSAPAEAYRKAFAETEIRRENYHDDPGTRQLSPSAVSSDTTQLSQTMLEKMGGEPAVHVPVATLRRTRTGEMREISKDVYHIGKERSYADWSIMDNSAVSRSHADILHHDGKYFVKDTNSLNHSYLNGEMLTSNQEYPLRSGDTLLFANEEFEFKIK